jgi:methyl-accepting chemotaxis protein
MSAALTMFLVTRGRAGIAGSIMVALQLMIILLAAQYKPSQMFIVTSSFFLYPTVVLAVIYSPASVHASALAASIGLLVYNRIRFDPAAAGHFIEIISSGTVTAVLNILLTYILALIAMRSLRIALAISRDETGKSIEKNNHITRLMDTIRTSYNDLTSSISATDSAISNMFVNIQSEASTIEQLVASIEEISTSTTGIEQTTGEQSEAVSSLNTSISHLSGLIDSLQVYGKDLQAEFDSITGMAATGTDSSRSLADVNRKTLENSNNIQTIAGIIDDFFDKINLLSLNAAIEAARAGDQGRGFAVVADEISKLADHSSGELKKIKDLVNTNRNDVVFSSSIIENIIQFIDMLNRSLVTVREKAMDTLNVIARQKELQGAMLDGAGDVRTHSDFIKVSSREQSVAIQEIAKSIENTNSLVQENALSAQVLRESYDKLKSLAENLKGIMAA